MRLKDWKAEYKRFDKEEETLTEFCKRNNLNYRTTSINFCKIRRKEESESKEANKSNAQGKESDWYEIIKKKGLPEKEEIIKSNAKAQSENLKTESKESPIKILIGKISIEVREGFNKNLLKEVIEVLK